MTDSLFIWAQIIGTTAMAVQILAMQIKNPRMVVLIHAPACALWSLQFYLLGGYIAAFINLFAAFKDASLSKVNDKYVPYVVGTFLVAVMSAGTMSFQFWYDVLPLLATLVYNSAMLINRDNRPLVARAVIGCQLLWLGYDFIVMSYAGFACGLLVIISSLIGMYRYEDWNIGKCYKSFLPSLAKNLFAFPNFRTYP